MNDTVMRAGVYISPGKLAVQSRPVPHPGPGEVLLRVHVCGICGSDLHLLHSDPPFLPAGRTLGHEMAGTIAALGAGVSGYKPGDAVVVEPLLTCGVCSCCKEGRDSICPQMKIFGVHTDGGFADYLCVPAHRLYPVPADLDLRTASLTEPVAVAVHGLRRAQFQAGQRLLVLGAGVIGLAVVGVARAWGAREILLTARHPHQAELGRRMGADRVLSEPESTLEALTALGQETPVEMVAETVGGTSSTLMLAGAALAPGGTVLVLGLSLAPVPVSTFPLLNKEARLQWSNCYYSRYPGGSDFQESLRLIRQHGSIFAQMLTHSVPLDSVDRGVAIASDKKLGSVKVTVMIQP